MSTAARSYGIYEMSLCGTYETALVHMQPIITRVCVCKCSRDGHEDLVSRPRGEWLHLATKHVLVMTTARHPLPC